MRLLFTVYNEFRRFRVMKNDAQQLNAFKRCFHQQSTDNANRIDHSRNNMFLSIIRTPVRIRLKLERNHAINFQRVAQSDCNEIMSIYSVSHKCSVITTATLDRSYHDDLLLSGQCFAQAFGYHYHTQWTPRYPGGIHPTPMQQFLEELAAAALSSYTAISFQILNNSLNY